MLSSLLQGATATRWTMYTRGLVKPYAIHDTPSVVPTEMRPKFPLSDGQHGSPYPHTLKLSIRRASHGLRIGCVDSVLEAFRRPAATWPVRAASVDAPPQSEFGSEYSATRADSRLCRC